MNSDTSSTELDALNVIIRELSAFDKEIQIRLLQSVTAFLDIEILSESVTRTISGEYSNNQAEPFPSSGGVGFSDREELTPKEFILEKEPKTINDRVACLAFYLTHYRNSPHFKTLDISKLNTEAAQPKFTNSTYAVAEAFKRGLLVQAGKGKKQLSALAEQYVQTLPDREVAKKILRRIRPQRKKATPGNK